MYSLVNIAAVCRDLARLPQGGAVVDDLLDAFALDEDALAVLDRMHDPVASALRDVVLEECEARPGALQLLGAVRTVAATHGWPAYAAAAAELDRAPIGGAADLVRFVGDEVLDAAWRHTMGLSVARWPRAIELVTDGVLASYAGPGCGPSASRLGRLWRRWLATPHPGPAVVADPALADLLARLRTADTALPERAADELSRAQAAGWSWSEAMHEACWAVHLTGRGRSSAVAQLSALRALLALAGPARPRPRAVAAVAAAVHGTAVADLLPEHTLAGLTGPLRRALAG